MSETKTIHIGDILSVLVGKVVSHDGVGGVYKVLDWMTGESLFMHQLGRATDVCRPVLETVFPDLARIPLPELGENKIVIFEWVDEIAEEYGQWFEVPKLSEGYWAPLDPLTELIDTLGEDNVVLHLSDPIGRVM